MPYGTLLWSLCEGAYVVALGHVGCVSLVCWGVETKRAKGDELFTLKASAAEGAFSDNALLAILEWGDFLVVPVEFVSPARRYVRGNYKLASVGPLAMRRTGENTPVLTFAARNAFWRLNKVVLTTLAKDQGVPVPSSLYQLVHDLVRKLLLGVSDEELARIMALRDCAPPQGIPKEIDDVFFEDVLGESESKDVKDSFLWATRFISIISAQSRQPALDSIHNTLIECDLNISVLRSCCVPVPVFWRVHTRESFPVPRVILTRLGHTLCPTPRALSYIRLGSRPARSLKHVFLLQCTLV